MNNLLELQEKNGRTILSYHYKKVQDIDDVILELLAEADVEGFITGNLNRSNGTVDYDVTGYTAMSSMQKTPATAEVLHSVLDNLYHLLAYLEDSFIDEEYVLFNKDYIFFEPDSKRLYLIVLPCQGLEDSSEDLSECMKNIIDSFEYKSAADQSYADEVRTAVDQKMRSLLDMQDIISIDSVNVSTASNWEIKTTEHEYDEPMDHVIEAEVRDEESDQEDIHNDAEDVQIFKTEEDIKKKTIEEYQQEEIVMMEALTERIKQELRIEVEAEVREELRSEVEAQVRAELYSEIEAQIRKKLLSESEETASEEEEQKVPYLIRRKTGEVIRLNKGTFILGKMDACCDYAVNSNSVSRMHAIVKYNEMTDEYSIVDCNSTNHTYLNGKQIPAEVPFVLEDGMHIHLALEAFVFQIRG